jgi:CRP-like cAMP-binding protein
LTNHRVAAPYLSHQRAFGRPANDRETALLQHPNGSPGCLDTVDLHVLSHVAAHQDSAAKGKLLIVEGGLVNNVSILLTGWAIRYKSLPDGRRQILNFVLPGDIVGVFGLLLRTAACGVETLTPVTMYSITSRQLLNAFRRTPRLAIELSWLSNRDERKLDEQIMRIGRRSASERMAHLFMELHHRLLHIGLSEEASRRFPVTQTVLADALGMSQVHANRSFRSLVRQGLVALHNGEILLLDPGTLARLADFDPDYLVRERHPFARQRAAHG